MVNKSANQTDRSSIGGGAAAGLELDGETDESLPTPPETDVMAGCPDPKTCNDPTVTLGGSDSQAAA